MDQKKRSKRRGTVIEDVIYVGQSAEDGKHGPYTNYYFKNGNDETMGMGGIRSIDEQMDEGIKSGNIVEGKTMLKVVYIGPIAKKGEQVGPLSFKKYSVLMDNSWRSEEVGQACANETACDPSEEEESLPL